MPRKRRLYFPDVSLHVIQRGNNRGAIVIDDTDRKIFMAFLRHAAYRNGLTIHGYALMDTHYHLLVTPADAQALPDTIQEFGGRYVQYFNMRHRRIGSLWSGRYRGLLIMDERYWLTCLRYIEQNPVRAQMVENAAEYGWSSYAVHAYGADSTLVVPHRNYLGLGCTASERQAAYRQMCGAALNELELVEQRLIWRPKRT
jgi:putative transposase